MERLSAAEIAYAQAAATAPATAEMALHMHGGMGFTWDIPVHLYVRRMRDSFSSRGATSARSAVAARVLEAVL
jgi:alkylation response protein AidB-like acyl-CoA dehydrogenase